MISPERLKALPSALLQDVDAGVRKAERITSSLGAAHQEVETSDVRAEQLSWAILAVESTPRRSD